MAYFCCRLLLCGVLGQPFATNRTSENLQNTYPPVGILRPGVCATVRPNLPRHEDLHHPPRSILSPGSRRSKCPSGDLHGLLLLPFASLRGAGAALRHKSNGRESTKYISPSGHFEARGLRHCAAMPGHNVPPLPLPNCPDRNRRVERAHVNALRTSFCGVRGAGWMQSDRAARSPSKTWTKLPGI